MGRLLHIRDKGALNAHLHSGFLEFFKGSTVLGFLTAQDAARQRAEQAEAADVARAFSQAAQYIALAYALQPGRDIYQRSLKVGAPSLCPRRR